VHSPAPPAPAEPVDAGDRWWRRPVVWGLTIAFSGQAFAYYGLTAWLPVLLADRLGMTPAQAGVSASIFQIAALAGAVGVPVLLRRCSGPRTAMAVVCGAWLVFLLGLLVVPASWALWCAFGGAAQGGGLTVIFALVVRKARDAAENRRMSALVQGGGYTVAATGPFVLGVVHEASGEWTAPLAVVIGSILVLTVAGLLSSRERATRPG
jgi:CP family cyanate transporter-like MFS transporter